MRQKHGLRSTCLILEELLRAAWKQLEDPDVKEGSETGGIA
jgi:hypothetical protein